MNTTAKAEAEIKGLVDKRFSNQVVHYLGIQYASIAERFAISLLREGFGDKKDFTTFGPRCPQPPMNVAESMHVPKHIQQDPPESEDELLCCNLNVSCPLDSSATHLPVLFWIHGGGQATSYPTAQNRLGDPGPLVAHSIELGKPIILVTINYRLNIFGFGHEHSEKNVGLQDQMVALQWVKQNISQFRGDKDNITVGGESAGGSYTHALLASGAGFERAILASGSLYTSPPRPKGPCNELIQRIKDELKLEKLEQSVGRTDNISTVALDHLAHAIERQGIHSLWMWQTPSLSKWDDDSRLFGKPKGVMVGDCKVESVIYEKTINSMTGKQIRSCFQTDPADLGENIARVYGIDSQNGDAACRIGALYFINDARFAFGAQQIARNTNKAGGKAYQYYFDEVNPFANPAEAKAHHAVDLLWVFGGYDDDLNEEMRGFGKVVRTKWVDFINGDEPWDPEEIYLYGPDGKHSRISREVALVGEANGLRRQRQFAVLADISHEVTHDIWRKLLGAVHPPTSLKI